MLSDLIQKNLFICPADRSPLSCQPGALVCGGCGRHYQINGNVISFVCDDERPMWSKVLEEHLSSKSETTMASDMEANYSYARRTFIDNPAYNNFVNRVSARSGVVVDLASGPSGYFAPILDRLAPDTVFIASDACPAVIKAHAAVNHGNPFFIMDVDLDKNLPFADGSVDVFTGNLLNNVEGYAALIKEASRALKPGGLFAVHEMFFEKGTRTYEYLLERSAVYSSLEVFIGVCERAGLELAYGNGEVSKEIVGKLDSGDLLPLDDSDRAIMRYVYFTKRQPVKGE